ncbi:MAG: hypothetical protein GY850_12865, partial [bacterium]|nr:hypothetical protein [bacterium]
YCSIGAITMLDGRPAFNKAICIKCAGCEEFCPESAIRVEKMGYKVVAGGSGARHPTVAQTVTEFTDLDGVLIILDKAIQLVKKNAVKSARVFSLSAVIAESGIERLR